MKILVNLPTGKQELIEVGEGGDYSDQSAIVWHEGIDGTMPSITLGGMVRNGGSLNYDQTRKDTHDAAVLPEIKTQKITELQSAYAAEIYANIDYDGKTWVADELAQDTLAKVLSPGSVPVGQHWRDVTETSNTVTYAYLQGLALAILERGTPAEANLNTKITSVNAATTESEVNAITY